MRSASASAPRAVPIVGLLTTMRITLVMPPGRSASHASRLTVNDSMSPPQPRTALSITLDSEGADACSSMGTGVAGPSAERALRPERIRERVLDTPIDIIEWDDTVARILSWGAARESRTVALCNAHSLVTAQRDLSFGRILDDMDLATADGMSVVWVLRMLGHATQQRINGPDLMWRCCERAAPSNLSIYLLGSTERTLALLESRLMAAFPTLRIAGMHSPPFRPLTVDEDAKLVSDINASGAHIVFVSLGCPKQEAWIAHHRGRIASVMLGVGAAFDFLSGERSRAPQWIQDKGLEWLYRLVHEPFRLTGRYFSTNSRFIVGAARQLARGRDQRRWSSRT